MFNFLHTFRPEPIIFSIGNLQVHWYAVLMIIGGLAGFFVVSKLAEKYNIAKSDIEEFLIYFVIGAVVLARLYYVIYAWDFYSQNLLDIFKIWQGGLAVHGVMLGGFLALYIFSKVKKINGWLLADIVVVGFSLAQAIGRNGNYFNQEIFGKPTALPWGIPIDVVYRPVEYLSNFYFHPMFLYEVIGSLFIFFVLILLHLRRFRLHEKVNGNIFLIYLTLYSVLRFFTEFLRVDYSPIIFGLRWPQFLSFWLIIIGLIWLCYRNFCQKKI